MSLQYRDGFRKVGGSSPLAPTRSIPLSSWLARGGNREDFAFLRAFRPLSSMTLGVQYVDTAPNMPRQALGYTL